MEHMKHLAAIAAEDVRVLEEKERTYRGSWKRRGGVGAFFVISRVWDRLEGIVSRPSYTLNRSRVGMDNLEVGQWDFFAHCEANTTGEDGSVLACVRDLRRYLMLVEAEMVARGLVLARDANVRSEEERLVPRAVPVEDSNRHAERMAYITRENIPMAWRDYYQEAGQDGFYRIKSVVSPGLWNSMPHPMQELYTPKAGGYVLMEGS